MLGKRLRLARASAGLSLRDLEARLGNLVSAQAIGKYEREEMMPSSRVLIALADALGVSESYLLGQGDVHLEDVAFRKNAITSRKEEAQVQAAVISRIEPYLEIEEILRVASLEWDRPREAPYPVRELADAERAADSLRRHWDLGGNPIPALAELLEERGIKVLCLDLPGSVSGLTCQVRRGNARSVPVIIINNGDTGERHRFTLAHELGHLVMEVDADVDEEKAAHRFAGAFLMPAEAIWAEIGRRRRSISLGELRQLKRLFGASLQAIACRCKDLGVLGQPTIRRMFTFFERQGWRTAPYAEPDLMPRENPERFKRLCFRALAEEAISEAKAAELLGLTVRSLNREMEEPLAA